MTSLRIRTALSAFNLLSVAALLAGCASSPTIITNSDPSTDFMSLRTFDFMQPLATDRGNVRSLLSGQMIDATTHELEKLGMRRDANNPDVLINFMVETQEQIRSRNTSASVGMHRGGRYGMWGGTVSTPTIEQTTEGQLTIDMIDPARNQLVWQGVAVNRVTDNIRQNQAEAVAFFVAQIFTEFP